MGSSARIVTAVGAFVFFFIVAIMLVFMRNPFTGKLSLNLNKIVPPNLFNTLALTKYSLLGWTGTKKIYK